MTIFRHNKTGKLYTIIHLRGGHKYLGRPYKAIPYKWEGKELGGFAKGKSVELKDFTPYASVHYRVPATNISNSVAGRAKRIYP